MICTSAEANKMLKQLNDRLSRLYEKENEACTFVAATTENIEDARPEYDYAAMQREIAEIEYKIRKLKHGINIFNITHTVECFNMTIDELLVYMPQLTARIDKLADMVSTPAKKRLISNGRSNLIEYEYVNFDIPTAENDYESALEARTGAQLALDKINNSVKMEIDI